MEFLSLKHCTVHGYEIALGEIGFPYYENFDKLDDASSNFIQKLMEVIDKVALIKILKIKRNSQERFGSEINSLRNTKKLNFI